MNFIKQEISLTDKMMIKKIDDELSLIDNVPANDDKNAKITDSILEKINKLLKYESKEENLKKLNFMHQLIASCFLSGKDDLVQHQKKLNALEKSKDLDDESRDKFIVQCRDYYKKMRANTSMYGDLVNNSIDFLDADLDLLNQLKYKHKIIGAINEVIQRHAQKFNFSDITEEEKKILDFIEKQGGFVYRIASKSDNPFMNHLIIHMESQTAVVLTEQKRTQKRVVERDKNHQIQVKEYIKSKTIIEQQLKNTFD